MNLILLEQNDFTGQDEVVLKGRRYQHMTEILKVSTGQALRVGLINGKTGQGRVLEATAKHVRMSVVFTDAPSPKIDATVILALPRPPVLKRVLASVAAMGVRHLIILQTRRVEKSYWQSPALEPMALKEQLLLGLEQAGDTVLPEIWLRKRFKPFVEDELDNMIEGRLAFVAHPEGSAPCPCNVKKPFVVAIGPEGGFIPYEIEALQKKGFQCVSLGCRPLRVEPAIHMLLGRLIKI